MCNVWYDWGIFDHKGRQDDQEGVPAQILCLLDIHNWKDKDNSAGQYAIVRKFVSPPRKNQGNTSNIVLNGKLSNRLHIVHSTQFWRQLL